MYLHVSTALQWLPEYTWILCASRGERQVLKDPNFQRPYNSHCILHFLLIHLCRQCRTKSYVYYHAHQQCSTQCNSNTLNGYSTRFGIILAHVSWSAKHSLQLPFPATWIRLTTRVKTFVPAACIKVDSQEHCTFSE